MISDFFQLLDRMDSFKKVVLLLTTGLVCLILFMGYRLSETIVIRQNWENVPHVIRTVNPCNLVQIREDVFLVSISYPIPKNVKAETLTFTSSFWVNKKNSEDFNELCDQLVLAVFSNNAEKILKPYYDDIIGESK